MREDTLVRSDAAGPELTMRAYREAVARIRTLPDRERLLQLMELNRSRRPGVDALIEDLLREALQPRADDGPALLRFWLNHFNVFWAKDAVGPALRSYVDDALRPNIRRRFRDLLAAVTTHPAMLVYLDNASNNVSRLNENHARELLELHTMGVDGGYGQRDVQEVARALTGFGLRPLHEVNWPAAVRPLVRERGEFLFDPRRHDRRPKQVLGQRIEAAGAEDLDVLVDILAGHPATAMHIARRLCAFLVGDEVPRDVLAEVAQAFRESGGDLGATTATAKRLAQDARDRLPPTFKDPWRWVVSAVRLLADGRTVPNVKPLAGWIAALGQAPFARTSPDGYPLRGSEWVSPGQLMQRVELAPRIAGVVAGMPGMDGGAAELLERPGVKSAVESLGERSRGAMLRARSPREKLGLLLASPEFMHWRAGEDLA